MPNEYQKATGPTPEPSGESAPRQFLERLLERRRVSRELDRITGMHRYRPQPRGPK